MGRNLRKLKDILLWRLEMAALNLSDPYDADDIERARIYVRAAIVLAEELD